MNSSDYEQIERAIRFFEANATRQPSLDEVAEHMGLSPFHFQRLFKRWAGISPKRFLQFLTVEYAKHSLQQSSRILDAANVAGLSSPSRLHDLFVSIEAMTPGEYKNDGKTLVIRYGFHDSPFGECLAAMTDQGVCAIDFVNNRKEGLNRLKQQWKSAKFAADPTATAPIVHQLRHALEDRSLGKVKLHLKGTNFQIKVWEALLRIPAGHLVTYHSVADSIGAPGASRAVGSAVAQNCVAVLIPCHRVIRKTGLIGDYRWGSERKRAIVGYEAARKKTAVYRQ